MVVILYLTLQVVVQVLDELLLPEAAAEAQVLVVTQLTTVVQEVGADM
jgi:hypothetical protein